jgi:tRNA-uridine 2-sulfurtransferase
LLWGHYVSLKKGKKGFELYSGKDDGKDQSYFLYELSQKDLGHSLFPIGKYTKSEIREIAKKEGLPNWNKKGTSGVCFVGRVNFQEFLGKKIKEKSGNVIDSNGNVLGKHKGIMFYTIGQRVGNHIGVQINKPQGQEEKRWYVAKKLPRNKLMVAPEGDKLLKTKEVKIKSIHFINNKELGRLKARIRHLGELYSGILKKVGRGFEFHFDRGVFGVASGQALVLYSGKKVIGGGEIKTN